MGKSYPPPPPTLIPWGICKSWLWAHKRGRCVPVPNQLQYLGGGDATPHQGSTTELTLLAQVWVSQLQSSECVSLSPASHLPYGGMDWREMPFPPSALRQMRKLAL